MYKRQEVEGAIAEGVELVTLAAPVRIEADENGRATACLLYTSYCAVGSCGDYLTEGLLADIPCGEHALNVGVHVVVGQDIVCLLYTSRCV